MKPTSEITATANRIHLWDNIKSLLIFCVVIGHFVDFFTDASPTCRSIFLFIYSFHMPLFLFISGLFHRDKNTLSKVINYAAIGFAVKILIAVSNFAFKGNMRFSLLSDNGIPWFMFVLAGCTAVTYLFRNQNKSFLLTAAVVLALFAGYDKSIGDYLYLSRFFVFFPFYLLGNIIKSDRVIALRNKHKYLSLPAALILIAWGLVCLLMTDKLYFLRPFLTGRNPYSSPEGGLIRLAAYCLSLVLGAAIIFIVPKFRLPLITKIGANTMNVFVWHWPMLTALDYFFHIKDWFFTNTAGKVGVILVGVLLTVLLSAVPIFSFPTKQIKSAVFKTK